MIEENFSEYNSVDSNEEKGYLGSLVKKGLIYNAYYGEKTYMYCVTELGLNICKELGIDISHIQIFE